MRQASKIIGLTILFIVLFEAYAWFKMNQSIPEVSKNHKVENPSIQESIPEVPLPPDWVEIKDVQLDIRYATENNFTESIIYPCGKCYLRTPVALALKKVQNALTTKNLSLYIFDCYRPSPAQQKLWDIVPDARYVTPPKKGSMHNRGMAIDLTLQDENGNLLNMGTDYDFFGKDAHTDHSDLPADVLKNRNILKNAMESEGFKGIRTEWWHYSHKSEAFPLSNWEWPCD